MQLFLCIILIFCSLYSTATLAWGQTGHRVTGAIAEQYLDPIAAGYVREILPNESLADMSTWADEMRSNPNEFWQKQAGPFHYVTVPQGKVYEEVTAPPQGDAVTALKRFREMLLNPNSSIEDKQLALRFTIHIIGDLHQPLHAGNGTDRGGNDVKVSFQWRESNLHRVWDTDLIASQQLSYSEWTEKLISKLSLPELATWYSTDPLVWIAESTAIRDTIYPENTNQLSWQYSYDNIPIVKQRLSQGGVRIALYLNNLFNTLARQAEN